MLNAGTTLLSAESSPLFALADHSTFIHVILDALRFHQDIINTILIEFPGLWCDLGTNFCYICKEFQNDLVSITGGHCVFTQHTTIVLNQILPVFDSKLYSFDQAQTCKIIKSFFGFFCFFFIGYAMQLRVLD